MQRGREGAERIQNWGRRRMGERNLHNKNDSRLGLAELGFFKVGHVDSLGVAPLVLGLSGNLFGNLGRQLAAVQHSHTSSSRHFSDHLFLLLSLWRFTRSSTNLCFPTSSSPSSLAFPLHTFISVPGHWLTASVHRLHPCIIGCMAVPGSVWQDGRMEEKGCNGMTA